MLLHPLIDRLVVARRLGDDVRRSERSTRESGQRVAHGVVARRRGADPMPAQPASEVAPVGADVRGAAGPSARATHDGLAATHALDRGEDAQVDRQSDGVVVRIRELEEWIVRRVGSVRRHAAKPRMRAG